MSVSSSLYNLFKYKFRVCFYRSLVLIPYFVAALDTSVLAAIQHLAQQNRQHIAALQAEVNILKKLQQKVGAAHVQNETGKPQTNGSDSDGHSAEMLERLQNHLMTLQEEQVTLAGQLANMLDDTKDEFNRKQVCHFKLFTLFLQVYRKLIDKI